MQVGGDVDGEAASDLSGGAVAMSGDGNTVIIGAAGNDANGNGSGHARVFHLAGGDWVQVGVDIDGEAEGDQSGRAVATSADGNTVVIGAQYNDGNGEDSGHARMYALGAPEVLVCGDIAGTADELAAAGYNVVIGTDAADFCPAPPATISSWVSTART